MWIYNPRSIIGKKKTDVCLSVASSNRRSLGGWVFNFVVSSKGWDLYFQVYIHIYIHIYADESCHPKSGWTSKKFNCIKNKFLSWVYIHKNGVFQMGRMKLTIWMLVKNTNSWSCHRNPLKVSLILEIRSYNLAQACFQFPSISRTLRKFIFKDSIFFSKCSVLSLH